MDLAYCLFRSEFGTRTCWGQIRTSLLIRAISERTTSCVLGIYTRLSSSVVISKWSRQPSTRMAFLKSWRTPPLRRSGWAPNTACEERQDGQMVSMGHRQPLLGLTSIWPASPTVQINVLSEVLGFEKIYFETESHSVAQAGLELWSCTWW